MKRIFSILVLLALVVVLAASCNKVCTCERNVFGITPAKEYPDATEEECAERNQDAELIGGLCKMQ